MNKAKVTKAIVNYRHPVYPGGPRCGTCSMFRVPDSCTLVTGKIKPADVCDRWDPRAGGRHGK